MMTLKHTKKSYQNCALRYQLTIAMGMFLSCTLRMIRASSSGAVSQAMRSMQLAKAEECCSPVNQLSGLHHWYKGSEPNPKKSRVLGRHVSRVVHNHPLHVVVEDLFAVLQCLPRGGGDMLTEEVRRCVVDIVHCVVARPTQVATGIVILPVLIADLEVVGRVVVSRTEDVNRLKTLLFCRLLHPIRASLKDMHPRRLMTKLERVSATTTVTPSLQKDEAHTRLDQAARCSHSGIIYPSGL